MSSLTPVVVTGANGFVGQGICRALVERGVAVRAIVRRTGTAPELPELVEVVGDFADPELAAEAVAGAGAVVTTAHPSSSDRATQHRVAVEGTPMLAHAAADAGVRRLIHISTGAVYDRSPGVGDVDESSALVSDDAGDYAVTKRDADLALAAVDGITRVILRPPAILGNGPTSTWNTLTPDAMREHERARHAIGDQSFPWVHLDDLASLTADLASGRIADAATPDDGPVAGACTLVNVVSGCAKRRDYVSTVATALGIDPIWDDGPAWTGRLLADRAHGWGWQPTVDLPQALAELAASVRSRS